MHMRAVLIGLAFQATPPPRACAPCPRRRRVERPRRFSIAAFLSLGIAVFTASTSAGSVASASPPSARRSSGRNATEKSGDASSTRTQAATVSRFIRISRRATRHGVLRMASALQVIDVQMAATPKRRCRRSSKR